jgi:hypothetical protein
MELYERNYAQLRLLAPALSSLDGLEHISHVAGCLPLFLRIVERGRYTTTVNLSYQFDDNHSAPDMTIRIYHDARVAECMSGLIHGRRHEQRRTRALDDSWRLNRFLYKWLRYCRHRGHRF